MTKAPDHKCTPYCDGQKYCVEPGTHTMGVASPRISDLGLRQMLSACRDWENAEIVRVAPAPDLKPKDCELRIDRYCGLAENPEPLELTWLVTYLEQQCDKAK